MQTWFYCFYNGGELQGTDINDRFTVVISSSRGIVAEVHLSRYGRTGGIIMIGQML